MHAKLSVRGHPNEKIISPFLIRTLILSPPNRSELFHADPRHFYRLWRHPFYRSRTILSSNLCRVRRSFKPYQNEHGSVKEVGENHVTLLRKFAWKSCSTTHLLFHSSNSKILKAFPKNFYHRNEAYNKCPAKEKNEARKAKEGGRREN